MGGTMYLTKIVRDEVKFCFRQHLGLAGKIPGTTSYSLYAPRVSGREHALPSMRTLRRLAKKFLRCKHFNLAVERNTSPLSKTWLYVEIDVGILREDRAAFLAAVAVNSKIERTEEETVCRLDR